VADNIAIADAITQIDPAALFAGSTPEDCVTELAKSIVGVESFATNSKLLAYLTENLVSPVKETRSLLKTVFVPDPKELEAGGDTAVALVDQIIDSFSNPITAMLVAQRTAIDATLDNLGTIFNGDGDQQKGFLQEFADRARYILKSLYFNGNDGDKNLAGILLYAISESIPSIETEETYLRQLKKLIGESLDEATSLPDAFVPELPNAAVATRLCEAEAALIRVEQNLRLQNTFDRARFREATDAVCESKDMLFDGTVDQKFIDTHAKNFGGLTSRQLAQLKSGKFMPNIEYKAKLVAIEKLAQAHKRQREAVDEFHQNLSGALEVLDDLANPQIGTLVSLLVETLRRQIATLRLELEAQGMGYETFETDPKKAKVAEDQSVWGYAGQQAGAYAQLYAYCFLMTKFSRIFGAIEKALSAESKIVRTIRDFIGYYKAEACGDDGLGVRITDAVVAYLRVNQDRLNGKVADNRDILRTGRELKHLITQRIAWLSCIKRHLFFGNESVGKAIVAAGQSLRVLNSTIRVMDNGYYAYSDALKKFNLKKLLGIGEDYNALDIMLQALQCLVINCDNSFLLDTANLARKTVDDEAKSRIRGPITMETLDAAPAGAMQARMSGRVKSLLKLIRMLQQLTNLDLKKLCDAGNKSKADQTAPPPTPPKTIYAGGPAPVGSPFEPRLA